MLRLTVQERTVIGTVIFLLVVGWGVSKWRPDPPPPEHVQPVAKS